MFVFSPLSLFRADYSCSPAGGCGDALGQLRLHCQLRPPHLRRGSLQYEFALSPRLLPPNSSSSSLTLSPVLSVRIMLRFRATIP
jgi:hypothetical protein